MEQELVKIEPEHVDKVWFLCAPMLEKAILRSEGYININDLYHLIMVKQFDLWVLFGESSGIDLCGVGRLDFHPQKTVLCVNFVGASDARVFKDFRKMLAQVEKEAKKLGATETIFYARKGWKKLFPEFKEKYTVLTKKYEA